MNSDKWENLPTDEILTEILKQCETNPEYKDIADAINDQLEKLFYQYEGNLKDPSVNIVDKILGQSENSIMEDTKNLVLKIFDDQKQFITIKNSALASTQKSSNGE
ncbi:hypothetical protein TRFO_02500 [Tritrichomonas foetus]|uniref:Uncharacterized protein n=1 Tax=Tritrichomonas foetus TaxID=1144522 RepID=A0A1J4L1T2_9EUKA|nr:hypothetical protein TRFO_02500 [Tritrichomonas foetus]|eukprot:OHT17479.1 hypothetical protein TRFO_02500 [Tritrichomonas foetus]